MVFPYNREKGIVRRKSEKNTTDLKLSLIMEVVQFMFIYKCSIKPYINMIK